MLKLFFETFFILLQKMLRLLLILAPVLLIFGIKIEPLNKVAICLLIIGVVIACLLLINYYIAKFTY